MNYLPQPTVATRQIFQTVINVGEILRQLKLYSKYVRGARLVLVSTVPVTSLEHQALSDEGVVVVVLGESFER